MKNCIHPKLSLNICNSHLQGISAVNKAEVYSVGFVDDFLSVPDDARTLPHLPATLSLSNLFKMRFLFLFYV